MVLSGQLDGLETLKRIRAISPSTQVVILSAYQDNALVEPALCSGAIGYVLKRSDPEQVITAIRDAARGRHHVDPHILAGLVEKMRDGHDPQSPKPDLTPREKELVKLVAKGMTNAEIAHELVIAVPTVKTHVSNILDKLGVTDRRQITRLAAKDDPRLK
jgi:NarL family two-component system response regulator LiaR